MIKMILLTLLLMTLELFSSTLIAIGWCYGKTL